MNEIMIAAFADTVEYIKSDIEDAMLSHWNESVLRYYFCRALAKGNREAILLVECNRIDLVVSMAALRAMVEFKLYIHRRRFDVYSGESRGFKGGPSQKNLSEFRGCVDQLHERPSITGMSKYIVLVYSDPTDGSRPTKTFSKDYAEYRHPSDNVGLKLLNQSKLIPASSAIVQAQLYEIACQ